MAFNFTEMNSTLTNINTFMGRLTTWLSRDGGAPVTGFRAQLNTSGEEGDALIHIPIASVAAPAFADKITDDASAEWRIIEVRQGNGVTTPCQLKAIAFWETVDLQASTNGTWATVTASIPCTIDAQQSYEDFDEYSTLTTEFTARMQYQTTPTQKMRLKWGSRYLYVTGIRPDIKFSQSMEMDCREDEA